MQICLIGPSYPFRGGITHHTTLLYRYLRKKHLVSFYSFSRQYPQWLFPGKTDRDTSEAPLYEEGVEAILDSLNPITWWKVIRKVERQKPDLLIIPWWTYFWTPQFWIIATLVKWFSRATTILFICHNVVDHDSHFFSRACARAVLKRGDRFLVHSEMDREKLKSIIPDNLITLAFHPVYDFFNSEGLSKRDARERLSLEGEIMLFFGFIRPYKGLDDLIEAMPVVLAKRPGFELNTLCRKSLSRYSISCASIWRL